MDYIRLGFKRWLDISGRSSRTEYIIFTGTFFLLGIIGAMIDDIFGKFIATIIAIPMIFLFIAAFIPHFTLAIRRLHDFNFPGFILLIAYIIPVVNLFMLIALAAVPGSRGENKYGGEPGVPSDYLGKI